MSQLFLVRHGQASFGAANYDQLSPLGYQQAAWLGEHFAELGIQFSRVVTGTLARQQQTAAQILETSGQHVAIETDPGFNEFDFHTLVRVYCHSSGIEVPDTHDGGRLFFQMLRKAIHAWSQDQLYARTVELTTSQAPAQPALENWSMFCDRVSNAMQALCAHEREHNVLVVSSGGAMAMALSQILDCGVETLINLNMQTRNTGIHHLFFNAKGFQLAGFNNQPHLQKQGRLHALTYT
ncbi:histidine phosphatase family protein [Gammaproteobacteria bacterium LSUCC0112]|nr:histidine phosphatase family protein [Gammaproteobacteria bacterium LSUCC0112]